ncbi:MAG: hypothetical protein C0518_10460 [Opitutus sp.]|nr:hypothetical protein [Opitutus sp.]
MSFARPRRLLVLLAQASLATLVVYAGLFALASFIPLLRPVIRVAFNVVGWSHALWVRVFPAHPDSLIQVSNGSLIGTVLTTLVTFFLLLLGVAAWRQRS